MNENTKIEWTDKTWNPVSGCTKVSPGCAHCYAERITERFHGPGSFENVVLHPERLEQPFHIRKPSRIFVNSMSDLFHEDVPEEFIADVFREMIFCSQHTFQILTKRARRMMEVVKGFRAYSTAPKNIWLGVSCENQHFAQVRIPALLDTPCAIRFVSAEPLLGPLELNLWFVEGLNKGVGIDWVICGGESGPGARPMNPEWARSLRDQCKDAGVAFFMKQMGGVHDKGGAIDSIPEDLRVREFPE